MNQLDKNQEDRRKSLRLQYDNKAIIVRCDTMERFEVKTHNLSPLGMGVSFTGTVEDMTGKDIIIVTQTLIMYATITRMVAIKDGYEAGIRAKQFSPEVLTYLFEQIGGAERIQ